MPDRSFRVRGIDHVEIAAPAGFEAAAHYFFGELLGLAEIPKPTTLPNPGVWFQIGAQQIHIGTETPFAPARKAHPALLVDQLAARLEAANISVTWDTNLPGYRRVYTTDPWGNRLELLEPLG